MVGKAVAAMPKRSKVLGHETKKLKRGLGGKMYGKEDRMMMDIISYTCRKSWKPSSQWLECC
jgi:hypothetical protein